MPADADALPWGDHLRCRPRAGAVVRGLARDGTGRPRRPERKGPDRRRRLPRRGGGGHPRRRVRARRNQRAGADARRRAHARRRCRRPDRDPGPDRQPRPRSRGRGERGARRLPRPAHDRGDPGLRPREGRGRPRRPVGLLAARVPHAGRREAPAHAGRAGRSGAPPSGGGRRGLRVHGELGGPEGRGNRTRYPVAARRGDRERRARRTDRAPAKRGGPAGPLPGRGPSGGAPPCPGGGPSPLQRRRHHERHRARGRPCRLSRVCATP